MTDSTFEALLTGQLREYAQAGVRPIDRYAIAEGTIVAGRRRGIGWRWSLGRSRRPAVLVLVGLLILALAASAAFVGGRLLTSPGDTGTYDAIFLRYSSEAPGRDVDVIAVAPDGQERLVRRLDSSMLESGGFGTFGSVSQEGWIAVQAALGPRSEQWVLMGLTRPDLEPTFVPSQAVIGGAWAPDGLFVTTRERGPVGSIKVVEAATGLTRSSLDLSLPGGGLYLMLAADGSVLVVTTDGGYAVAPLDGGPLAPGVPPLAPRMGARWLAPGGSTMYVCGGGDCSASKDGFVSTIGDDGTSTLWYDGQIEGAQVRDASFSPDGRSVWILLDQVQGEDHIAVIAKAEQPGDPRVIGTVDLGPGVAHMWFSGLAPDDSTVAVGHWLGELGGTTTDGPMMLMSASGRVTPVDTGTLIGFMPVVPTHDPVDPTPEPSADGATPTPAPTSDMTVRQTALTVHRSGHTATRLGDGRVLITGGFSGYPSDDTAQAEIYDPVTGTFAPTGATSGQLQQSTATLLSDGRVLVVGGLATGDSYAAQASAEIYDPATGRFDAVGSLATPRYGHAAVRLLDGRVAIIGGSDGIPGATPSIELYDPATGTFTSGPSDPRLARYGASAVVLDDGRVLIVGGYDPATGSGDSAIYAAGVLYDPVTGSLTSTAPVRDGPAFISPGRPIGPAIKSADGSVLIAIEVTTGDWGLTSFDPATASFTSVTSLDGDPGVRAPTLLDDGRVFFVLQDQADCRVMKAAIFDPASGLAKVVGEVPGIGGCNVAPVSTVTLLPDGSVLVAGGNISGGESTEHASVIRVNP